MLSRQAGSSMIELMLAVTAGVFFISMLMTAIANVTALGKAKREGAQLAAGAVALDSYLRTHGVSIINNLPVAGFGDRMRPTAEELRVGTFLASYMATTTALGGNLSFLVRRGPQNDLFGLVCDTQNVTERGQPSPVLAGEVVMAASGSGLRTSIADPATLNGPGFTGVPSPINGPAIVCAWAYRARPV